MHEMTLTFQFTPHGLVRVGLGPERTVYVPIQTERDRSAQMSRHYESVWSSELAEIFIAAYPDHIELTLAVRATAEYTAKLSGRLHGLCPGLEKEGNGFGVHPWREKAEASGKNGNE
jgi:hypothetical protein